MKRSKRIYILLGVLAAVCLATFAVVKLEQRQEQIKNSDEVILSVAAADVQSLRWNYGERVLPIQGMKTLSGTGTRTRPSLSVRIR